jgi:hypothetical protein
MEYFCKATEKGKLVWVGFDCHEIHFCSLFASFAMVHKTLIAFSSSLHENVVFLTQKATAHEALDS